MIKLFLNKVATRAGHKSCRPIASIGDQLNTRFTGGEHSTSYAVTGSLTVLGGRLRGRSPTAGRGSRRPTVAH